MCRDKDMGENDVHDDGDEILEFNMAGTFLSALINGDYTGLTDEDEEQLDAFIKMIEKEYTGAFIWSVITEEGSFMMCDVCQKMANCYEVSLTVM